MRNLLKLIKTKNVLIATTPHDLVVTKNGIDIKVPTVCIVAPVSTLMCKTTK